MLIRMGLILRYFLRVLIPLILLIIVLSGCSTISAISKYKSGYDYLMADDYENAIKEFEKSIEANSELASFSYASYINIGVCYQWMGNYDKAAEAYNKGINKAPKRAYYGYENLAELKYETGDLDAAYDLIKKAKKLVESADYWKLEKDSNYGPDFIKTIVLGVHDFYEMRIWNREMIREYELGNYKLATDLANKIINKDFKYVYTGFVTSSDKQIITRVQTGSLSDLNGIIRKDKLLEINGIPVKTFMDVVNAIKSILTDYGGTAYFKIERSDRIIDVIMPLSYPEIETAKTLIKKMKFIAEGKIKNEKIIGDAPTIKILEPRMARGVKIVAKQQVFFSILASDRKSLKGVYVNDTPCSKIDASVFEKTILAGNASKYTISMPIVQGDNVFTVKAVNSRGTKTEQKVAIEGNAASLKESVNIYKHRVAVVIGINKYNPWPGLEYSVKDAEAVRDRLEKMGYDKVIELYDRQATRGAINRVLGDDLLSMLESDDSLMVYFAGHGATERLPDGSEEGYIIPVDGSMDNYRGTAISMTQIHDLIKKYRAKHILFVFDSCYSGLGLKRGRGQKTKDAFVMNMAQKKARQILTAGGKDEQAQEYGGHGVFTQAFLDALNKQEGNMPNKDGYILASDLGQFVRKQVGEKTQFNQTPMFGWLDGEGDFIFEIN